ncbi:MAG TPA: hypothetical protein VFX50_12240 [Gemmatimonadales bacterium]|nr:hypothetical protein [Gemmatimonadales bacterium]
MSVAASTGWRSGWSRLAEVLLAEIPADEIDGIWQFLPIRAGRRELGTAIVTRRDGARRRVYTARYALTIRGKERGSFEGRVEEVGSGPAEALDLMLLDVRRRLEEDDVPSPVPVGTWVAAAGDGAPHA